ncbi:hypothetical protein JOQ06_025303, partial [Pogonophryne albipinna]
SETLGPNKLMFCIKTTTPDFLQQLQACCTDMIQVHATAVCPSAVVSEGRGHHQGGAKKNTLPKCSPSRHRRNNMSAKDGHVLLVMSTRGGGKVDTMFLFSAFSRGGYHVS